MSSLRASRPIKGLLGKMESLSCSVPLKHSFQGHRRTPKPPQSLTDFFVRSRTTNNSLPPPTMRFQTWPFLIAELVQFTAAANITILGQGDLHQDTADSFLSCLNATGVRYRLYIDAGSTVVLPPGNRTLDTGGVDEFLLHCMMMACGTMDIAAEDTDEDNEEHMASVYASIVTYDWLVDQGARGLRAIGTRPAKTLEDVFVRDEETDRRHDIQFQPKTAMSNCEGSKNPMYIHCLLMAAELAGSKRLLSILKPFLICLLFVYPALGIKKPVAFIKFESHVCVAQVKTSQSTLFCRRLPAKGFATPGTGTPRFPDLDSNPNSTFAVAGNRKLGADMGIQNEGLEAPNELSNEHDEHLQPPTEASSETQPMPNGGLEGWLSVLAGFCVFVNSWGLISCYGAFQEFYQTVLLPDESPSTISWIGSIQATLIVMVGMVTGPLVDSGYLRPLIVSGSFLVVFGMMMLSLATEYYQVLLAQGFCVGIGGGITYIPAMVVISSHFTTKRPIAIGCASIGSSVGSVIFPILFRQVQPIINFAWSVRCIAFINLFLALITCAILCRRPGKKTRTRSLIELKALTHLPFMLLSLSMTCVMLAYYVPIFYIATYARSALNTPTSLSFYLVSITNGASAFGRTVPYFLASGGTRIKPIFILIAFVAAAAVVMFTWIATTNTAGFIVWACYWGFVSGVLVTAPTSIVAHKAFCPDSDFLGTRMGMMWGISSFGSLVGTPVAGALVNLETADFVRAQVFAGCLMVGAVVLQVWPVVCVVRVDRGAGKVQ
ncbi:MFS general substrate transporter [Aspergillus welwitschiae]|uniref:MFS general substrate transporter n=1 Tax=Aspergillus welwitschiae TaxID=1341132 RepID=A0A3F3Q767_9EURO|nr:MFS general substrate transporter [Aspergillus welwitschiae]RDH35064.1 MFS general substrate transporter [Aspergillus welwitschiae]